jgi:hypothetical protein
MTRDEILSMAREAGIEVHPRKEIARIGLDALTGCDSTNKLAKFAELATAKERTARIEAQQRLADMQELAAKAGLAHRMAVQRCVHAAVAEAVATEREACAMVCESLFVPDQVLGAHPDYLEGKHMAKSQCASNIRARGTP